MLPTPEEILATESKERPLHVEPWVLAHLSRLWQTMKKNIEQSIQQSTAVGTQGPPRNGQSGPASAQNRF